MRIRDAFSCTDFSELNQLFFHLKSGRQPTEFWWRLQVLAWCCASAITAYTDPRIHVTSCIDHIFELDCNDERLRGLLEKYTCRFKLPTDVALSESLANRSERSGAKLSFKTNAVKQLQAIPPMTVLLARHLMRTR